LPHFLPFNDDFEQNTIGKKIGCKIAQKNGGAKSHN